MKINSKRAKVILERHNELLNLAEQFIRDKDRYAGELRITSDGTIECWENHACHCHPEYWWDQKATWEEFMEWLDKQSS
jgi:hypothetical protein